MNSPNIGIKGHGEAIEYNSGKNDRSILEELSNEKHIGETESPDNGSTHEDFPDAEPAPSEVPEESNTRIIELAPGELPTLKHVEPKFDAATAQNALDDQEVEGGITPVKTTGPIKSLSDPSSDGMIIKQRSRSDMESDSMKNKYEVTGFRVEWKRDNGSIEVLDIRDYFNDLETAKASVISGKYIMPLNSGGYTMTRICGGAPIVCFNDRQIFEHVNGDWRRS